MMEQEQIVATVRSTTVEVFSTMLGLDVTIGDPRTEVNAPGPSDGVIAVIGLAGAWIGTGSLSCDASMACRMSSSMLGTEYTEVNEDVLDALSEIANMIFGNFKTIAETYLGPLGLSIPTVVYGLSFSARTAGKEKWIVVPFLCGNDAVEIKVCLTPNRGLPSHWHRPVISDHTGCSP
jgi:chemotaxis protein CheX